MASAFPIIQDMLPKAQVIDTEARGKGRYALRRQRDQVDRERVVKSQDMTECPRRSSRNVTRSQPVLTATSGIRKRKRIGQCFEEYHPQASSRERQKISEEKTSQTSNPIGYWCREHRWPEEYFLPDKTSHTMARKKSTTSIRRKRSAGDLGTQTSSTPSDQKSRDQKSAPYRDARYTVLLETKGSYLDKSERGIADKSVQIIQALREKEHTVPRESLFRDDLFDVTCRNVRDRNETRVIRDISQLIVPSAENLTTHGAKELRCLIESVNEGWNNSIPVTSVRPQPDYGVGFRREVFTEEQLQKLQPFVGDLTDQSFFMGTYYLYFPFFTCEVKCGAAALDIADRQNAHSMTIAVRAVVELFRLVKRETEIDREILGFSVSHDHQSVRIYGHYPVIDGKKTTYHRHPIRKFDFTEMDGKEKWTSYNFTRSVYCSWVPEHFKRLCSAIDAIPADLDFEVSQTELHFADLSSGLSQDIANQQIIDSETYSAASENDDQMRSIQSNTTPATSLAHSSTHKKPKEVEHKDYFNIHMPSVKCRATVSSLFTAVSGSLES